MGADAGVDIEDWRRKYFDSLKQLTVDEQRWKTLDAVLRRLVARLCIISSGLDPAVDDCLQRLSRAMRDEAGADVLEPLLAELGSVIIRTAPPTIATQPTPLAPLVADALPDAVAGAAPDATTDAAAAAPALSIGSVFDPLLDQIEAGTVQREALDALREKLAHAQTPDAVAAALATLAQMVHEQLAGLHREKSEVERTLQQFTAQLDEMHRYLAQEVAERSEVESSHQDLNQRVLGEVQALDTRIRDAVDLPSLQQQVAARLQSIGVHLRQFLSREEQRSRAYRERAKSMEARVRELDRETRLLQRSLRHEQQMALTDALTGIPNRLAYEERMRHQVARRKRYGHPCVIAAWDIDYFKRINDTYGHQAGDKVLRLIGQALLKAVRTSDFVARYGGEEFIMLLEETPLPEASALIERLRVSIAELAFHFRGQPVSITMSCGLTTLTEHDSAESAFERADQLLYRAKNEGRNRSVIG